MMADVGIRILRIKHFAIHQQSNLNNHHSSIIKEGLSPSKSAVVAKQLRFFICHGGGPHTARRSAATNLYLQGVDVKVIADLGGWENFNALMVYLRASGLETAQMAVKLAFFQ